MSSIFSLSEPVIALEKMLTETFTQAQQKKMGIIATSKSTNLKQGMPRLIFILVYLFSSFSCICLADVLIQCNFSSNQARIQLRNNTMQ